MWRPDDDGPSNAPQLRRAVPPDGPGATTARIARVLGALPAVSGAAAVANVALGCIVLVGWATGLRGLTTFLRNDLPAKPAAALLLVLAGLAVLLWRLHRPAPRRIARVLGIVIAGVAGAMLLEYVTGTSFGIDFSIPTADVVAEGAPYPGRIALLASVALLAAGLAIASLGASWREMHPSELLGLACALIGAFDVLGYAYGASTAAMMGLSTRTSAPVALGLLILGFGIVAAIPDHGLMRLLFDPGIAGRAARRILPATAIVAPLVGWLEVWAQRAGFVDDPLGTLAMVATAVAIAWVTAWWAVAPGRSAEMALRENIADLERVQVGLRSSQERVQALYESLSDALFVQILPSNGIMPPFLEVNDVACRRLGYTREELLTKSPYDIDAPESGVDLRPIVARVRAGETVVYEQVHMARDGTRIPVEITTRQMTLEGRPAVFTLARDITERKSAEVARARLVAAVEQSPESVVITDPAGTIEYVNPAFERITGYARNEAIGQNPRILKSGQQSPAFYKGMWAALSAGRPWVADLVNRRKDGTLFEEEAVISPVRDERGVTTGYVAVKHDVTRERAVELRATGLARERALIADAIGQVHAGGSAEATAQAICQQVINLTGLYMTGIFIFELDGRAKPLSIVTTDGKSFPVRHLPLRRSHHLRERAEVGPWVEAWTNRPWHPYNQATVDAGVDEAAFAPLHHDGALFGILVASRQQSSETALSEGLPALVEFAGLAGATLGPGVSGRTEVARARARLSSVIAGRAFQPVFQPIVDIRHRRIVAYEALIRFDDGTAPESRFEEATQVGLGIELEEATLGAALEAGRGLPRRAWLHVNTSPALIVRGEPLRSLLARSDRHIVLEVTEHTVIDDYAAFRAAVAALGPRVSLAVDDAGAGFASLRHILELRPAFVKLDRSLIEGIDTDPARQAMVAGMRQFADEAHCRLVAEGVESPAELQQLTKRGIRLAQGYLLGRPAAVGPDGDAGRTAAGNGAIESPAVSPAKVSP